MAKTKILVVDDSPDVGGLLKSCMESDGYACRFVRSGSEALSHLSRDRYDLVILDLKMPGMDGYEVCRRIRANPEFCFLPIVMLTVMNQGTNAIQAFQSGADDYVRKPFEPSELLARIGALLSRAQRGIDANPLTGLPGNNQIRREISARLESGESFSVYYLDLDNFKEFNDKCGYDAGDETILLMAEILSEKRKRLPRAFLGHIGGDDFILIAAPGGEEKVCAEIMETFDRRSSILYRGNGLGEGSPAPRKGEASTKYPLMTLSIGVTTNPAETLVDVRRLGEIMADVKSHAKKYKGSSYYITRRTPSTGGRDIALPPSSLLGRNRPGGMPSPLYSSEDRRPQVRTENGAHLLSPGEGYGYGEKEMDPLPFFSISLLPVCSDRWTP